MKGNIIYKKIIPAISPEYAEFPESLHPDIRDFLAGQNIKALYTHEAEAFFHGYGWRKYSDHHTYCQR